MVHTPDPWQYEPDGKLNDEPYYRIHANGVDIAYTRNAHFSVGSEEDARLIAAAPDLLTALKDCFAFLKGYDMQGMTEGEVVSNARAAIRKAEGSAS